MAEEKSEISVGFRIFLIGMEITILIAILGGAWLINKLLLAPPLIVAFRLCRLKIETKYDIFHMATIFGCMIVSTGICIFGLYISLPITVSLISNIIIGVVFAIITWHVQEIIDLKKRLNNTINSNFRSVDNAICNLGYNIATQFAGVDKAFCTLGYQTQAGFNSLANQISSCCCDLKQLNLENRYLNEKQTCDIIGAINAGNQRLVDIYTNDKLDALRAENTALKGQISNSRQTADIVSQLRDPGCPVASYVVPNPNCCYNPFGFGFGSGYGFNGFNSGCCGASVQ